MGSRPAVERAAATRRAAFRAPVATVGAPPEACAGVSVALPVNEGVAYAWSGADWSGASVLTTRELDRLLRLRAGEVAEIEAGLRSVESACRQRGFMLQRAIGRPAPDDAPRRLTLAVTIEEGPQFRMGELTIAGLSGRDAASLRRRWRLAAGDVDDDAYARRFRSENGWPARRLSLELALDRDRGVVNVRITATRRGDG